MPRSDSVKFLASIFCFVEKLPYFFAAILIRLSCCFVLSHRFAASSWLIFMADRHG